MHPSNQSAVPILNWPKAFRAFLWLSLIWAGVAILPSLNDFVREFPNIEGEKAFQVVARVLVPPIAILMAGVSVYALGFGLTGIWRKFGAAHWDRLPSNIQRGIARLYAAIAAPWVLYFAYRAVEDAGRYSRSKYVVGDLIVLVSLPLFPIALFMIGGWVLDGFRKPESEGPFASKSVERPTHKSASEKAQAIFEKLNFLLRDEKAQVAFVPEPIRSEILGGSACDEIAGANGEFGRDLRNPIPVNGPLGELVYLTSLSVATSRQPVMFHRLGAIGKIDVFETVSFDAKNWDILFLDFYHPTKSRRAPDGYVIADHEGTRLPRGTNYFLAEFPTRLPDAIADACEGLIGLRLRPTEVRTVVESSRFSRPASHQARYSSLIRHVAK